MRQPSNPITHVGALARPWRRDLMCAAVWALGVAGGGVSRTFARESPALPSLLAAGVPSRTVRAAALNRAVHQIVDHPRIFDDPYALPVLGPLVTGELQAAIDRGSRAMRVAIVMRSRYAEDCLAAAVAGGTRQYVVLGAGLDTFACRNPHVDAGLSVFEVDHPATQTDKRLRLAQARIAPRAGTTFVPIDVETQGLRAALAAAGFRFDRRAFFSMLGVTIYVSEQGGMETLRVAASCPAGSEVAFSFSLPDWMLGDAALARRRRTMAALAGLGEPWITFHDPDELARRLLEQGYATAELLRPAEANRRYFGGRTDGLAVVDAHMMLARV